MWRHHYSVTQPCHLPAGTGHGAQSRGRRVSRLTYSSITPPYHALGCSCWSLPVLRVDGFDCGFGVAANHCHLDNLLTRLQGEELVITGFHTLPNQASIITDGSFTRFSDNPYRASNLTLNKQPRPVRPDDLHIF